MDPDPTYYYGKLRHIKVIFLDVLTNTTSRHQHQHHWCSSKIWLLNFIQQIPDPERWQEGLICNINICIKIIHNSHRLYDPCWTFLYLNFFCVTSSGHQTKGKLLNLNICELGSVFKIDLGGESGSDGGSNHFSRRIRSPCFNSIWIRFHIRFLLCKVKNYILPVRHWRLMLASFFYTVWGRIL